MVHTWPVQGNLHMCEYCIGDAIKFVEEKWPIDLANIKLVPLFILVAPTMQNTFPYLIFILWEGGGEEELHVYKSM